MSLDDYLDGLLSSGSSASSKKAILKVTKLIESIGSIMVKSTERMEDALASLENRILALEGGRPMASPSVSSGAPPSAAAPNLSAAAPPGDSIGAPNLSAAPSTPSPSSDPPQGGNPLAGSGFASEIANMAGSLSKAPPSERPAGPGGPGESAGPGGPGESAGPGGPGESAGPAPTDPMGGPSSSMITGAIEGLTKIDPEEHKKERQAAQNKEALESGAGASPFGYQSELKQKLQARSDKMDDDSPFEPAPVAPTAPQRSTTQMKEALQSELRDAFSGLLESDTREDEEE